MTILFAAFILGLVFNATPGAVFAETVRRGATGGYRASLSVQVGSLVGDATWAALGLMGVGLLLQLDALKWPVGLIGAAYLFWLSLDSWKAASIAFSVPESQDVLVGSRIRTHKLLRAEFDANVSHGKH